MASKARLDMDHGFLHHIRRNQVARDNYDKEVKAKQSEVKKKPLDKERVRKPEISTYVPPPKSDKDLNKAQKKVLFQFEFEDEDKNVHPLIVYEGDDPRQLARRIGNRQNFTPTMIHVMGEFLHKKMVEAAG